MAENPKTYLETRRVGVDVQKNLQGGGRRWSKQSPPYLLNAPVLSVKGSIYRVAVKLKMENAQNRASRVVSTRGLAIICGWRR